MRRSPLIPLALLLALAAAVPAAAEDNFLSAKRVIRVTDGIAGGADRAEAKRNAVENARRKALERVASSFVHSYERVENFVLTEDRIIQDIHAKILKTKVRKVEYPYENVALVTVDFTVEYFDLDFFVREIRKSAESAMVRSLVISGWGQVYNRNYFHGLLCFAATYGSLATAYGFSLKTGGLKREYGEADGRYADLLYGRYRDSYLQTAAWLSIGLGSWAYSMWEAFEDREITNLKLDEVHGRFFPDFYYTREKSFIQKGMDRAVPRW
jgi:hypothetical protein